jgi:hypothetical protein
MTEALLASISALQHVFSRRKNLQSPSCNTFSCPSRNIRKIIIDKLGAFNLDNAYFIELNTLGDQLRLFTIYGSGVLNIGNHKEIVIGDLFDGSLNHTPYDSCHLILHPSFLRIMLGTTEGYDVALRGFFLSRLRLPHGSMRSIINRGFNRTYNRPFNGIKVPFYQ